MDLLLRGRVALVTGSSQGIGLAIARALCEEGCRVALNARGREGLAAAAAGLATSSAHVADVTSAEGARALIADVVQRWGALDVLVCNVGSGASFPPGQETDAEWRRMLELNLMAAMNAIAAARPHMAQTAAQTAAQTGAKTRGNAGGDRAIVCISSICGLAALGAPITYAAAKAALNAAVRGLARPLAAEGVRINAIAPGNILFKGGTWANKLAAAPEAVADMLAREVALNRLGTPEEIAHLAAFLASPRSSFITGSIVVADGGQLRG
jgi:3-oxoacyl-[acyl-carrier protein] reductase